jgi:O-antigen/teichoic acid export membrane protein
MEVVSAASTRVAPLGVSFAWTFAGNLVYGAGQWAMLSLFAKLGGGQMLGEYALALAAVTPVVMLTHLNLRAVLATDVAGRHPFGDYLAVRLAATVVGLAAVTAIAAGSALAAAIWMVGLAQSVENVSDLYYGAMQRRERMDQVARSMMARGALSVAALWAALWLTRNLVWAVAAVAAARVAVLLLYDMPRGAAGERVARTGMPAWRTILRTTLPLGVVLMLVALNANLPRYAIEHHLGTRALGAFAAVASFMTVGAAVVNALGQAALPRLARAFAAREMARFRGQVLRLACAVALLGAAGVAVAAVAGPLVLRVLYRAEYAAYAGVLVAAMAAAVLVWLAGALGYVLTSARAFDLQAPLLAIVAAASGAASWLLVPRYGLYGAVAALAIAACIQLGGQVWIIRRAA